MYGADAASPCALGRAALMSQYRHRDGPALADFIEPQRIVDHAVFEEDFVEAELARHLHQRLDRHAGMPLHWTKEEREAVILVIATGAREQDHVLRELAKGSPDLVAVHHPLLAAADGHGLLVGHI